MKSKEKNRKLLYFILIAVLIAALAVQILVEGSGLPGEDIGLGLLGAAIFALWGGWCLPVILARDTDYYHSEPQDDAAGKGDAEHG